MLVGELRKLLEGVDDDLEVTVRGGNVEFRMRTRPKRKGALTELAERMAAQSLKPGGKERG